MGPGHPGRKEGKYTKGKIKYPQLRYDTRLRLVRELDGYIYAEVSNYGYRRRAIQSSSFRWK